MISALAFLTVLGPSRPPHDRTLWWFPVVGALVGTALAGAHWGAHELWSPLVAGAVVVAVDLVLTGALHVDGLADTADGVLPHMDRRRRLEIMAEPDVGAFAIAVVVSVLLLRWAAFADAELEAGAFVAIWSSSRALVAIIPAIVPYARAGGLADPFLGGARRWLSLWLIPAGAALIAVRGSAGAAALIAAAVSAAAVVALAWRRLGGFTGDVLGAVILISETAALLLVVSQLS